MCACFLALLIQVELSGVAEAARCMLGVPYCFVVRAGSVQGYSLGLPHNALLALPFLRVGQPCVHTKSYFASSALSLGRAALRVGTASPTCAAKFCYLCTVLKWSSPMCTCSSVPISPVSLQDGQPHVSTQ